MMPSSFLKPVLTGLVVCSSLAGGRLVGGHEGFERGGAACNCLTITFIDCSLGGNPVTCSGQFKAPVVFPPNNLRCFNTTPNEFCREDNDPDCTTAHSDMATTHFCDSGA